MPGHAGASVQKSDPDQPSVPGQRDRGLLMRKRIALAGLLIVVVGFGAAVVPTVDEATRQQNATTSSPLARPLAVETIRVDPVNSFQTSREYTGTVVARRVSELSFERAGLLDNVQIEEGVAVAAGTSLATVDTEHLRTRRRETVARRAQAAALLAEFVAGPRQEDIDAATANVESLDAQVALLKLQTDRRSRLLNQNAVPQDEFERFAFGLKAREAQLKQGRHELEELVNGTRQEQIDAQRALVEQLDAAIEDIDIDLRKSELTAPFDGTISRRRTDEGTVVQAGQTILTIVEDSALEAWVGLPVEATTSLAVDSAQRVRIEGRLFEVRVSGRRPEVDPATRTRTVIFRLDPAAAEYVIHGQIVRLQLEETVEQSGFWLPTTALSEGERGLWSCMVVVPDSPSSASQSLRVDRRDVEVLHTESNRVLVRGTLNAGDRVIARGTHRVSTGQVVQVTD